MIAQLQMGAVESIENTAQGRTLQSQQGISVWEYTLNSPKRRWFKGFAGLGARRTPFQQRKEAVTIPDILYSSTGRMPFQNRYLKAV